MATRPRTCAPALLAMSTARARASRPCPQVFPWQPPSCLLLLFFLRRHTRANRVLWQVTAQQRPRGLGGADVQHAWQPAGTVRYLDEFACIPVNWRRYLQDNTIRQIAPGSFAGLGSVTIMSVHISHSNHATDFTLQILVKQLPHMARPRHVHAPHFAPDPVGPWCRHVHRLICFRSLSGNLLTSLPYNVFNGHAALTSLDLSSNAITAAGLPVATLAPLTALLSLFAATCMFSVIIPRGHQETRW